MRIVFIPLDERPCNSKFPQMISENNSKIDFVTLPLSFYGVKKKPADLTKIWNRLFQIVEEGDTLVVSMDMLLYGGLIPSRLHNLSKKTIEKRLSYLKKLKETKDIDILASNCIMRCPTYNSAEEEPDYYEHHGVSLHRSAYLKDKKDRVGLNDKEINELNSYYIPEEVLSDYEWRREFNEDVNIRVLELVKEGVIDSLVIPQDDATPYGYTAQSQARVLKYIEKFDLDNKVSIYPGADEVGCTLSGLAFNLHYNNRSKFYAFYSSTLGPMITPLYEDRPMNETLKHHILAIGGQLVDTPQEADIILAINSPGKIMQRAKEQIYNKDLTYTTFRNLRQFVNSIKYYLKNDKPVILSDSAYGNGGDLELLKILDESDLLDKILTYSAWNTNANTLGTALYAGIVENNTDERNVKQTIYRIIEDTLYQSKVRQELLNDYLPSINQKDYHFEEKIEQVKMKTKEKLLNEYNKLEISKKYNIKDLNVSFPWKRVFEIKLDFKIEN